jgi:Ca2+-binding EF-hand superfamily protein
MSKILPMIATATLFIGAAATAAEQPTFSEVDKNKDGYVSREEASMAPDIMKLFATVDANHDNQLSPTEYENALKQLQS